MCKVGTMSRHTSYSVPESELTKKTNGLSKLVIATLPLIGPWLRLHKHKKIAAECAAQRNRERKIQLLQLDRQYSGFLIVNNLTTIALAIYKMTVATFPLLHFSLATLFMGFAIYELFKVREINTKIHDIQKKVTL
jgi:hypothetical protein